MKDESSSLSTYVVSLDTFPPWFKPLTGPFPFYVFSQRYYYPVSHNNNNNLSSDRFQFREYYEMFEELVEKISTDTMNFLVSYLLGQLGVTLNSSVLIYCPVSTALEM